MRQTLKKNEVLRSGKEIKELFESGSSFFLYPYKIFYRVTPEVSPSPRILISVPKRNFKKAVDRNIIRRRIRESYRMNKHLFINQLEEMPPVSVVFTYIGKFILPYREINSKLKEVLLRLITVEVHKTDNKNE